MGPRVLCCSFSLLGQILEVDRHGCQLNSLRGPQKHPSTDLIPTSMLLKSTTNNRMLSACSTTKCHATTSGIRQMSKVFGDGGPGEGTLLQKVPSPGNHFHRNVRTNEQNRRHVSVEANQFSKRAPWIASPPLCKSSVIRMCPRAYVGPLILPLRDLASVCRVSRSFSMFLTDFRTF
jgi:hypothetical protein